MTAYHRLDDDKLLVFANTLLENAKSPTFEPYQAAIANLQKDTDDYNTKLQKSKNNGRIERDLKNQAKEELILTIDEYAFLISSKAVRTPSIILEAGFEYQSSSSKGNRQGDIMPPFGLSVTLSKNSGEIYLKFQLEDPKMVVKNGVEWSEDAGATWNNGTYFSGKKGTVKNLPTRKDLLIRARSIGTYNRESDFSVPISTFLP